MGGPSTIDLTWFLLGWICRNLPECGMQHDVTILTNQRMPIPQHRFPPVFQCSPGGLGWLLGLVVWNPNIYSKAGQSSSEKNIGWMIRFTMDYKIANRWFLWADHLPFWHTTKTNITLPRLRWASINFAHTTATPVTITVCPGWNGSPCPWRLPRTPQTVQNSRWFASPCPGLNQNLEDVFASRMLPEKLRCHIVSLLQNYLRPSPSHQRAVPWENVASIAQTSKLYIKKTHQII